MKSNLMKRILSICFSAFVLVSCQKEVSLEPGLGGGGTGGGGGGTGGGGSYYLRAKVEGTLKNFNNIATFQVVQYVPGQYSINIYGGVNSTSLEGLAMVINFDAGVTPTAGTYSEDAQGTDYILGGVYNPNSQTITWNAGFNPTSVLPLEIKITSLDSKEAKGTFKGAFYFQDLNNPGVPPGPDYKTITEGEFFLKVTK